MALVQGVGVAGQSVATATTPSITTTSGNALAFGAGVTVGLGGDLTSIQDSKTNIWTATPNSPKAEGGGNNNKQYMYTSPSITGGASHTFTVNLASAGYVDINVGEFSGRATSSIVDIDAGATDASGTSHTGPTFTPAAGSDVFLAEINDSAINPETMTPGGSWNAGSAEQDGNAGSAGHSQYQNNLANVSLSGSFTTGSSIATTSMMVALKVASSPTNSIIKKTMPGRKPGKQPPSYKFVPGVNTNVPIAVTGFSVVSAHGYGTLASVGAGSGFSAAFSAGNASLLATSILRGYSTTASMSYGSELGVEAESGLAATSSISYANLGAANNASGQSVSATVEYASLLSTAAISGQSVTGSINYGTIFDANIVAPPAGMVVTQAFVYGQLLASVPLAAMAPQTASSSGALLAANNALGLIVSSSVPYGDLQGLQAGAIFGLSAGSSYAFGNMSASLGTLPVIDTGGGVGFVPRGAKKQKKEKGMGPVMREGQVFGEEYLVSPDLGSPTQPNQAISKTSKSLTDDHSHAIMLLLHHLL